ncbi:MAG: hypothetical protein K2Y09_09515 [Nitrosomonas sp.]|uniref:hypothetical protein n=1 Tax=Nitrosomonas sp. TaxID=42353 RepID=UPI001DE57668|nr:hypothetical protein [Nitrosomonas sp.]MBX9895402.1 hypothetical protein [Nitrosomonas sp.]
MFRCDDFNCRVMFEDVHHQLGFADVGDAQFIAAIEQKFSLLLRVSLLFGDPAGALGCKAQNGGAGSFAAEDAAPGGEVLGQQDVM